MFCRSCGKELIGIPEHCTGCGNKPLAGGNFCNICGAKTKPSADFCFSCGTHLGQTAEFGISPKSRLSTALLAFFIGGLGVHRFYIGKVMTAIEMLVLTIVGYAASFRSITWLALICLIAVYIWAFVDFLFAVFGKMRDREGRLIKNW